LKASKAALTVASKAGSLTANIVANPLCQMADTP